MAKGIKSLGIVDADKWINSTSSAAATASVECEKDASKLLLDQETGENETTSVSQSVTGANDTAKVSNNNNNNNSSNNNNNNSSRNPDLDEVRVMQKVLASEVSISSEECIELLSKTSWDVHRAIKCVRLKRMLSSHNVDLQDCDWIEKLKQFNWNVRQASNYLIATRGSSDGSTEV